MKVRENKIIIAAAVGGLMGMLSLSSVNAADTAANPKTEGKCYGVVGAGEGECGGKDDSTGKSWGCAGNNPTADLGWKKMSQGECDKATKHKDAKAKKFVPNKG